MAGEPAGREEEDERQSDAIVQCFVRRLHADSGLLIEDQLADIPDELRPKVMGRLVAEHAEFRRRSGHAPRVEDYGHVQKEVLLDLSRAGVFDTQSASHGFPSTRVGPVSEPLGSTPIPDSSRKSSGASTGREASDGQGGTADIGSSRVASLQPGHSVGRFRLVEILGRGAFGEVWHARDTELNADVAIKFPLMQHQRSREVSEAMRKEARRQASLRNIPGIVAVYESGEANGRTYIVSQFVKGATFGERLPDLSRVERMRVVIGVARILHHAHQRHIVHRDVKPANILIDTDGQPHVIDFGIAATEREMADEPRRMVMGTYSYMSPEQLAGRSAEADPRADVYSLGAVLYECLLDRRPFVAPDLATFEKLVARRPPWLPRSIDASIDPRIEAVCTRCLEKDPADRYTSAADVADELEAALDGTGDPVSAEIPVVPSLPEPAPIARGGPLGPVVTSCLLVLGLAVVAWQQGWFFTSRHGATDPGTLPAPGVEVWRDLITDESEVELFVGALEFEVDEATRTLTIDSASRHGTFVQVGTTSLMNYDLEVTVAPEWRDHPNMSFGMFLRAGIERRGNGKNYHRADTLEVSRERRGTSWEFGWNVLLLTHRDWNAGPIFDTIVPGFRFTNPRDSVTWLVKVRDGGIAEVRFDGGLLRGATADLEQTQRTGGYGFFVQLGSARFERARIRTYPSPPHD